ncbi:hypothetical protein Tco_1048180, partial [Tanacetum coccineum]
NHDCEKLTLVDDGGNPLPKVVSTKNVDSDSEVEYVVDDPAVFMASTGLKRGTDSGYAYVDSETITQADGAQSSRVSVPLPDDPYVAVRQA